MAEVTKEMGIAVNDTKHLLSQISGERIRDEFIKGIKTSKSTKHFLGLLVKYNLFEAIFPNMKVTDNFMESNDPDLVVASLLAGNGSISKVLNGIKYPSDQINNIEFLLSLLNFNVEGIIGTVKKRQNIGISDEQVLEFAKFQGLDEKLVRNILNFRLSVNGNEVMDKYNLKGGDLGNKIKELEINNFRASLR